MAYFHHPLHQFFQDSGWLYDIPLDRPVIYMYQPSLTIEPTEV